MAELIPGTRFVELEGDDQVMWLGDLEALCGEIEHFITGVRPLGVRLRAGVHIGEVLERNGALRGIAVHVAARVMGEAAGCEVLVSDTVRDIVAGSGLRFVDRGLRELKGVEGERRLFAVAR